MPIPPMMMMIEAMTKMKTELRREKEGEEEEEVLTEPQAVSWVCLGHEETSSEGFQWLDYGAGETAVFVLPWQWLS